MPKRKSGLKTDKTNIDILYEEDGEEISALHFSLAAPSSLVGTACLHLKGRRKARASTGISSNPPRPEAKPDYTLPTLQSHTQGL